MAIHAEDTLFVALLSSCAKKKDLYTGSKVHADVLKHGFLEKSSYVVNALVSMYAKCGAFAKAKELLDGLCIRDVISWNALIAAYTQHGLSQDALECFELMQLKGPAPNKITFTCILKACSSIGAAEKGEKIHDEIARQGLLEKNVVLGTALVDMYAKCGALVKAQEVLEGLSAQDLISWNALLAGYAQQGQGRDALNCFEQMKHKGLSPDEVTFSCILKACGNIQAVDKGGQIHDEMKRQGLPGSNIVLGNALVDMYAKCGALAKAQEVLEELPGRDVISWSALIAGYTQHGQGHDALNCYDRMQREGLSPNAVTFICILKACGSVGAADKGERIHDEIARQGLLGNNTMLGNALVDMYVKCGALTKAQQVLQELAVRDVVSWSALIVGYAQQGQSEDALNCFKLMQQEGLSPNAVTFAGVLNACSHSGLVDEGQMYFENMSTQCGITPDSEHYTCMVDLFGRAGHFEKAVALIQRMPLSDYPAIWYALLGACQKWGDVSVGRWAFENALQVDQSDAATYVCMANIYTAAGMQEDAENIQTMRVKNEARKGPKCSWWLDISGEARESWSRTDIPNLHVQS